MLLKYLRNYKMKFITLSALLLSVCIYSHSQNLIGYTGKDIMKYMKTNHKEMNYNKVINNKFSYLKYSDNMDNQTILFFLNTDSVCRSVRVICDMSIKPLKIRELDKLYTKNDDNSWVDNRDGKTYYINITDSSWSCVISYESEK
jgi:hypothetical protein